MLKSQGRMKRWFREGRMSNYRTLRNTKARRPKPWKVCTAPVLFFIILAYMVNLWLAFRVVGDYDPSYKWKNKGDILWEKVNKKSKEPVIGKLGEAENYQYRSFAGSRLHDRSIQLTCEGTRHGNVFTVDAENEEIFDRFLHQIEVDTFFANYSKERDILERAAVLLEMRLEPVPNPEKNLHCVSHTHQGTSLPDRADSLPITLLKLTLDVGERLVTCQGREEVFTREQGFLEIVNKKGKHVLLEKVEHQVIQGKVTLTARLPPGVDVVTDIRGILCTLQFEKYYTLREGRGFLGGVLWEFLSNFTFSLFP